MLLAACATPPAGGNGAYDEVNDPLESMNRVVFSFNQFADGLLFKPLAILYTMLPTVVQDGIGGMLETMRTPVTLANNLMQGELERAGETVGRFAVNATAGIGGFFDVAAEFGLEGHREDFGQTLAVWGSGEGMYLVLPLFGPSNPRDAIGLGVDTFLDPLRYYLDTEPLLYRTAVRGIHERASVIDALDEIERTSIDFYATMRSLYRQHRDDVIRNGDPAPIVPIPGISFDDFEIPKEDQASLAE